jgi:hypothetical protein
MNTKSIVSMLVLIIPLFILIMASPLPGKNIDVISPWVTQAPVLDGQTNDWPDQASTFIKEKDVLVRVCNDSQYVYVMLGFRNALWAATIKRSGLTLKLDPQAKNKDVFTLKLVDGPSLEQIRALRGRDTTNNGQDMGQMPPDMERRDGMEERGRGRDIKMEKAFICTKKGYLIDKPIPPDGSEGPAAGCGLTAGFFAYEFKIPLGESSARFYGLGTKAGVKISIGLVWGEINKDGMKGRKPSRGGDSEGPPDGGGGGFPGGGGGGGGMGGGMGGPGGGHGGGKGGPGGGPGGKQGNMPEKQEIWLKAQLSLPEGTPSK